jgi:hypothetical protein
MPTFDDQIGDWTRAELHGDIEALDALLHPDFLGVGPFGFVLSRDEWVQRLRDGLRYTAFDWHCCVSAKRTRRVPRRGVGRVCEPNESTDYGPHESPI